jgi:hypothetical protein
MNILLCYEFHKQGEDYSRGYDIYLVLIITNIAESGVNHHKPKPFSPFYDHHKKCIIDHEYSTTCYL